MAAYVPRQGDFITITLDPQTGHEQRGRRPAIVVSKTHFNRRTRMAIVCPVTNTVRENPLHVAVPEGLGLTGVIMAEQVKSLDFRARGARFIVAAPPETVAEVLAILDACLY